MEQKCHICDYERDSNYWDDPDAGLSPIEVFEICYLCIDCRKSLFEHILNCSDCLNVLNKRKHNT